MGFCVAFMQQAEHKSLGVTLPYRVQDPRTSTPHPPHLGGLYVHMRSI